MLRKVCIILILFHMYFFEIKCSYKCTEDDSHTIKLICAIIKFRKRVVSYFEVKIAALERTRLRTKHGLIKFFRDVTNDTVPVNETLPVNDTLPVNGTFTNKTTTPTQTPVFRSKNIKKVTGTTTEALIVAHGYGGETHVIYTDDGYMIKIYRMKQNSEPYYAQRPTKGTVLLHHGLLGSSDDWLLLETPLTLPYMLLKSGYDVWLLNARGNKYTEVPPHPKNRRTFTFRDFSWHEMGTYDLPAAIIYIRNYTDISDMYYIGHSMGATALLVLLSTFPEYNNQLKSAILLAPLAFMYHSKGPLKYVTEVPNSTYEYLTTGVIPAEVIQSYCKGTYRACSNTLLFLANSGREMWDYDLMNSILSHVPAGGSTKTVAHYMQLIKSGHFRRFDYGPESNIEKYNTTRPPAYDLSTITLPISIICSSSDLLSTVPDITKLISQLKNVKTFQIIRKDDFSHLDFVWSREAPELVFNIVMNTLESISTSSLFNTENFDAVPSTLYDLLLDNNIEQ